MQGKKNTEEDFWVYVDKTEHCWNWTGGKDYDGYGQWAWGMKNIRAHRFSMKLAGKEIPAGMISRHLCNNPSCVNPEHIVAGTQKENIQDQIKAGTFSKTKYSQEKIKEVFDEYAAGGITLRELAVKHGMSKNTVFRYTRSCQ